MMKFRTIDIFICCPLNLIKMGNEDFTSESAYLCCVCEYSCLKRVRLMDLEKGVRKRDGRGEGFLTFGAREL